MADMEPKPEKMNRRNFLIKAAEWAGGLGVVSLLSGCYVRHRDSEPKKLTPDTIEYEQLLQASDKVWEGLSEVVNEELFDKSSLRFTQIDFTERDVVIKGTFQGKDPQVGVGFAVDFSDEPDKQGDRLQLDTEEGTKYLGELRYQDLNMRFFMGHNAGDVRKAKYGVRVVAYDTEGMRKRFEDVGSLIRRHLRIPDDTPMIPGQDFNGIHTFTSNRPGYGQLVEAPKRGLQTRIDEKEVDIRVRDGLIADRSIWVSNARVEISPLIINVTGDLAGNMSPGKVSFAEYLRKHVDSLKQNGSFWHNNSPSGDKKAPAEEYITRLAGEYLTPSTAAAVR